MNERMNERLKRVRKKLAMNQVEFAKTLHMAQTSYSKIETGENKLTDKNIALICHIFGVNEAWLRGEDGDEGCEMFIQDFAETLEEGELLYIFRRLSTEMKEFFLDMGRKLVVTSEKKYKSTNHPPAIPLEPIPPDDGGFEEDRDTG
jgi:transcriptional regulator with XRE-family HTH domain